MLPDCWVIKLFLQSAAFAYSLVICEVPDRQLFVKIVNFSKHQAVRTCGDCRVLIIASVIVDVSDLDDCLLRQKILHGLVNRDNEDRNQN